MLSFSFSNWDVQAYRIRGEKELKSIWERLWESILRGKKKSACSLHSGTLSYILHHSTPIYTTACLHCPPLQPTSTLAPSRAWWAPGSRSHWATPERWANSPYRALQCCRGQSMGKAEGIRVASLTSQHTPFSWRKPGSREALVSLLNSFEEGQRICDGLHTQKGDMPHPHRSASFAASSQREVPWKHPPAPPPMSHIWSTASLVSAFGNLH